MISVLPKLRLEHSGISNTSKKSIWKYSRAYIDAIFGVDYNVMTDWPLRLLFWDQTTQKLIAILKDVGNTAVFGLGSALKNLGHKISHLF